MKYGGKADVGYQGGRREKFKTLSKPFNSFHPTLRLVRVVCAGTRRNETTRWLTEAILVDVVEFAPA
jgi:hypothetical protein